MGRKHSRSNPTKPNPYDRTNKRRVSFNLSTKTTAHRVDVNHPKIIMSRTQPQQRYTKQTWLQTFLLSATLLITLPSLMIRCVILYCPDNGNGNSPGRVCQFSLLAIQKYGRYNDILSNQNTDNSGIETNVEIPIAVEEEHSKRKGVIKRVIDRHRQKRQKNKQLDNDYTIRQEKQPLHYLLEGASIFSHWKTKKQHHQHEQQQEQTKVNTNTTIEVDWKKWKYAMTDDFQLTSYQVGLVKELAKRVVLKAKNSTRKSSDSAGGDIDHSKTVVSKDFAERVSNVPWGGVTNVDETRWWPRKDKNLNKVSTQSEGARLLAAYLKIMKWPKDLHAKFPFKLCAKGCDSEVAILHTLEWREKYLPWCTSPKAIQYNEAGFIYHFGHSRAGSLQRLEADDGGKDLDYLGNVGHSMVWYSPGKATLDDPELYIRSLIYTLEAAVTDSLLRNNGEIGRFNLIVDCEGVGTKSIPSMAAVKKLFAFLQDHFPDRLGVLLLANLSGVGRMIMNMVMPFVTEDVKAKIHVIPSGRDKREDMLTQFIDLEHVPGFIGGKGSYMFNAEEYYHGSIGGVDKCVVSEERIKEYITTMPYHA